MKDKKIMFGIALAFIFLASVGFSYAYFSNAITNKDVKDQVVETGTLQLTYTDGPEINIQNMKPGNTINKTITVKNTGSLEAKYNIIWQELTNEITNDEMLIEGTCTSTSGNCDSIESSPISDKSIKKNISIASGVTHTYNLTITFKDTNASQNYNQGKKFSGVLGIEEYKDTAIYCTYDGELKQGTKYVNGQYTYSYKQEKNGDSWRNITEDGWGVVLTDKSSTNPVTSKLCTYINNKPIVSMYRMFGYSNASSLDLSSFDTSNVTNMSSMFSSSKATTLDVSNFDTSKVTDMSDMFSGSKATTLDVSNFDTSKVTDMANMFNSSQTSNLNLESFNTSKVTSMSWMFAGYTGKVLDLSGFDTSNVTNMSGMFADSIATSLNVSNFDTSKVTDMSSMFSSSKATTLDVSNFDTSKVTDMSNMFSGMELSSLDISSFDTSSVTTMEIMFYSSSNLKTIYASNKFIISNVQDDAGMFLGCSSLIGGNGTKYSDDHFDKEYARIDTSSTPGYLTLKTN